jgi:hypothetical protein
MGPRSRPNNTLVRMRDLVRVVCVVRDPSAHAQDNFIWKREYELEMKITLVKGRAIAVRKYI